MRFNDSIVLRFGDRRSTVKLTSKVSADPLRGLVYYKSEVGNSLLGKTIGDEIKIAEKSHSIEFISEE